MLSSSARFIFVWMLPCFLLAGLLPVQAAEPADKRPHVVFVVGTHHYSPQKTLPKFAERLEQYGFRTTVVLPQGDPERNKNGQGLPGLEVLKTADVAVFYMRFLTLPQEQMQHILDYVQAGKPVIGLRTSTHAFAYEKGHELEKWNEGFGRDVLGSKYFLHLQGNTTVEHVTAQRGQLLLNGVPAKFIDPGTLYQTELPADALPLLLGTGRSDKTGTATWPVAWSWKNQWGGKVFATTLGHAESFEYDALNRLLINAVHGLLGLTVDAPPQKIKVEQANKNLLRPIGLVEDHDPELERKSFQLLPGFEVNLFAAEPMLVNPIHMTWDAQGRLWVCCSTSYPQLKPGELPNDQIVVLEDTDHDGRADKSTIFAEGLSVPTGLELGDGGVYVASAPDLIFLKDTDGDLKADVREVVLTGFATEDNHHSISAWRWGPGGWLYFQEGTFMHSQIETPRGPVRLENGGVFQFRPRSLDLRVYADYRASNPWGHMFDRWGVGVLIDNPQLYYLAPVTANSRAKLAYESSGRGEKQCGGEFTSGRHLPAEFRGQIWTNQYKPHIVTRYSISDDGAGLFVKEQEPLLRFSSPNFRPVDLKMGPDGAVYVLDWYNPLIGHMQHSMRDERRDTTHGRVWRVTYKDRPLVQPPKLVGVPLGEVVAHLKDPEDWTRHQVKRVLYDSPASSAAEALRQFVASLDASDPEFEHHRLEALWSFQTIDVVEESLLRSVLASPDFRARAAACRVLRYWFDRLGTPSGGYESALELLGKAVQDEHPRVRLEAVLSLGFVPDAQSVVLATKALDKPMDRYVEHALKLTIDGLQPHWLENYRMGKLKFDKPEHRNHALSNLLSDESVQVMIDMLNSGSVTPQQLEGPAAAVAQSATAGQLEKLVLAMVEHLREYKTRGKEATDPAALTVVLQSLESAARQRNVKPKGIETMLPRCFDVPDTATQAAAARLAGAWRLAKESNRLKGFVQGDYPLALQLASAQALGELGKPNQKFLESLIDEAQPQQKYFGVVGLAAADLKTAASQASVVLSVAPQQADPRPVVKAFTQRKNGSDLLTTALQTKPPHPQVAALLREHFILTGEQHAGLIKACGGGIAAGSLEDLLWKEDPKLLAEEMLKLGDAARGELIFRRKDLACLGCHGINNAGSIIGPDLAAIGSSSPPDYVVDSILRPSKVIKEFFETINIQTDDGRLISGILVNHDDRQVVIRDPLQGGKEVTILASQIDDMSKGKSLMPNGLANKLKSRQEFLDLTRFISELGRPGPYARDVSQVIRRWRVGQLAQQNAAELSPQLDAISAGGAAAYSMVSGVLTAAEWKGEQPWAVVVGQVDVTAAGPAELKLNDSRGLTIYLDGQPLPADKLNAVPLSVGRKTLAFVIDRAERGETGLRAEFVEVPKSTAAFKVVGGP